MSQLLHRKHEVSGRQLGAKRRLDVAAELTTASVVHPNSLPHGIFQIHLLSKETGKWEGKRRESTLEMGVLVFITFITC